MGKGELQAEFPGLGEDGGDYRGAEVLEFINEEVVGEIVLHGFVAVRFLGIMKRGVVAPTFIVTWTPPSVRIVAASIALQ